jgi:hypothetical protein
MSRERPAEPPRTVPDGERGRKRETPKQAKARQDLEHLKRARGPAFLAPFFNPQARPRMAGPQFLRAGYLARVLEALQEFYTRRPRPWRELHRDACRQTHKERLNAARGGRHAGCR